MQLRYFAKLEQFQGTGVGHIWDSSRASLVQVGFLLFCGEEAQGLEEISVYLLGKRPFCVLELAITAIWAGSFLLLAAIRCRCSHWMLALMVIARFPSVHVLKLQVNYRKIAHIMFKGQPTYIFIIIYFLIYV